VSGLDGLATQIGAIGESARAALEEKHAAREVALRTSRRVIQCCAASIRAAHREEFDEAERLAGEARGHLDEADAAITEHPDLRYAGYLHDAQKEYAEARLALAFVRGDSEIPTPDELGVEVPAYLNGMAEAASELRRRLLDLLRHGHLEQGEALLGAMDEVYSLLVTIDFPDAVTGGLRRTTDALRAVIERTRGDLTTTILQRRLQDTIEARLPKE